MRDPAKNCKSLSILARFRYVFVVGSDKFLIDFPIRIQGLKFEVIPSRFEETLDKTAFKYPFEYVLENSRQKALEVAGRVNKVSALNVIFWLYWRSLEKNF